MHKSHLCAVFFTTRVCSAILQAIDLMLSTCSWNVRTLVE